MCILLFSQVFFCPETCTRYISVRVPSFDKLLTLVAVALMNGFFYSGLYYGSPRREDSDSGNSSSGVPSSC